jgi:hypothetical protein
VEPGTKTNLTDCFQVINAKRILPFPTLESHLSLDANRQRLRMVKATLIRRETRLRANVSVGYTCLRKSVKWSYTLLHENSY